ncbi:MAG: phosphate/phosphite/phosphonate ABC transporter substrate-binding protein [Archangiaceae bacterium]|nr:phosphate/phosphite/phosphonate ABC transporter substrate-binding protein [Archangiaceae bacterium]
MSRFRRAVLAMVVSTACFEQPADHLPQPKPPSSSAFRFEAPPGVEKLKVGLVPSLSPDRMKATRAALISYLAGNLGLPIEVVVGSDYGEMGRLMARGEVDLAEFPPFAFVRARRQSRVTPLVSAISSGSSTSGGYIVVREDSPRRTLDDLKGARLGFVDPASTSGYLYPMKLFKDHGIEPSTFFKSIEFIGSHDGVLLALLDGRIDVGATWQGSFGALRASRNVDPLSFRVIAKMPRTPQDVWCARENLPPEVGQAVRQLLLQLSMRNRAERDILNAMRVNGYVAADLAAYAQVERIADELDAGSP